MTNFRTRSMLAIACLIVCGAAPVAAQQALPRLNPKLAGSVQIKTATIPASQSGVRVPGPPTRMLPKPPPLSATARRKLTTLREWGLRASTSALGTPILLSPQQPYLSTGGELRTRSGQALRVSYESTDTMPYGTIQLVSGRSFVVLNDVPATPKDWLLVECYVHGGRDSVYTFAGNYPRPSADLQPSIATALHSLREPSSGNIVSAVFEPNTASKRYFALSVEGPSDNPWDFGGCEITPVNL